MWSGPPGTEWLIVTLSCQEQLFPHHVSFHLSPSFHPPSKLWPCSPDNIRRQWDPHCIPDTEPQAYPLKTPPCTPEPLRASLVYNIYLLSHAMQGPVCHDGLAITTLGSLVVPKMGSFQAGWEHVKYLACAGFCWTETRLSTDSWVLALRSAHFSRQALNKAVEVSWARCLDYGVTLFI